MDNPTDTSPSYTLTSSLTFTKQCSFTVGAGMTLTAEEIAQINLAENMTIGSSVSATVSTSETFPGGPYEDILWYVAMVYTEKQGTCDLYGADGFDGAQNWDAITSIYPSVVTHSYLAATYN
jgi:hypothetical protein